MNEEFLSKDSKVKLTINDEGIFWDNEEGSRVFFPYGSIQPRKLMLVFGNLQLYYQDRPFNFMSCSYDKDRLKEAVAYANNKEAKAPKCLPKSIDEEEAKAIEHRMRCNVCGNVFCYNEADVLNNQKLYQKIHQEKSMQASSALALSFIQSNQHSEAIARLEAQIKDFTKCPTCGSTDLTELSEEGLKKMPKTENQTPASSPSPVEEIKQFKELLDMGIITQEEFDLKKKQLLGL